MEGIDLALLIQIFTGFKSTLPRPAGFANFRGTGRGGVRPAFWGAVRGSPFFRGAGRGGAHIPGNDVFDYLEGSKVVLEESHNMRPVNYSLYGSIVLFILLHIRYSTTYLSVMVGWFQLYLLFISLIVYKREKNTPLFNFTSCQLHFFSA